MKKSYEYNTVFCYFFFFSGLHGRGTRAASQRTGSPALTGSPLEGFPSSYCLLQGPDPAPQDAPGLRPDAGLYLEAEAFIYPSLLSRPTEAFIIGIRDTQANLETNAGESEPKRYHTAFHTEL